MLTEQNNHHVNAAEHSIQTYKNHFILAFAMTDTDYPLQLWDELTTQVQNTLNLLQASQIDPTKSAYDALNGHKYDWNRYPLAPPDCNAII